eukprot:755758-Hanusia_phi.AAC.1
MDKQKGEGNWKPGDQKRKGRGVVKWAGGEYEARGEERGGKKASKRLQVTSDKRLRGQASSAITLYVAHHVHDANIL